ncbi:MAG: hypothetical protein ACK5P5_09840 [Pseudobdellovibrionaceae bacterium]
MNRVIRLTLDDPKQCTHTFPIGYSNNEGTQPQHWGKLMYVEQNSAGDILISSCPEPLSNHPMRCQNVFRGTAKKLCDSEYNAIEVQKAVVLAGKTLLRLNPATAVPIGVIDIGESAYDSARDTFRLINPPRIGTERPSPEDPCPASRSLLERLRREDEAGVSHAFKQLDRETGEACPVKKLMDVFSQLTPDGFQQIKEPFIEISSNSSTTTPFTVSNDGRGSWYSSFLNNEETAQHAGRSSMTNPPRQGSASRAAPNPRPSGGRR